MFLLKVCERWSKQCCCYKGNCFYALGRQLTYQNGTLILQVLALYLMLETESVILYLFISVSLHMFYPSPGIWQPVQSHITHRGLPRPVMW